MTAGLELVAVSVRSLQEDGNREKDIARTARFD